MDLSAQTGIGVLDLVFIIHGFALPYKICSGSTLMINVGGSERIRGDARRAGAAPAAADGRRGTAKPGVATPGNETT